jgi:hypothetical protein
LINSPKLKARSIKRLKSRYLGPGLILRGPPVLSKLRAQGNSTIEGDEPMVFGFPDREGTEKLDKGRFTFLQPTV